MDKVTKTAARKLYENNTPFWITACNMRPQCGLLIDPTLAKNDFSSFDALVNAFSYYNCDNERGRYPAYYAAT